ncbi:LOB domain-containing 27-like [Olea europaea subsp. europaea]|uniref:LOB domain-containing 27-like n=1 Tax=Olea europaea subsp. europaea TaxID=158383 RepID=A0A8S0RLP3_OLEEU|nr:LOB domain-containing 27-like [Olea europaea subsp. europaea]
MTQDYDEIHQFFDIIDDRQSYVDSKEAYESSSESSMKDTRHSIELMAENELKSAAACFSLTNVN